MSTDLICSCRWRSSGHWVFGVWNVGNLCFWIPRHWWWRWWESRSRLDTDLCSPIVVTLSRSWSSITRSSSNPLLSCDYWRDSVAYRRQTRQMHLRVEFSHPLSTFALPWPWTGRACRCCPCLLWHAEQQSSDSVSSISGQLGHLGQQLVIQRREQRVRPPQVVNLLQNARCFLDNLLRGLLVQLHQIVQTECKARQDFLEFKLFFCAPIWRMSFFWEK